MSEMLSYLIPGVMTGFVYALIALGFVLIYKCSGVLNLAQGELVIIGAYMFYALSAQAGLPAGVGIVGTLLLAIGLGFLVERLVMRPLIGQPILAVILVTLAVAGLLRGIMILVWGPDTLSLPRLFPLGGVDFLGVSISYAHLFFVLVSVVLFAVLFLFFRYSQRGLSMMAVADDQQASQSVGVRVTMVLAMAWAIAALVSATGGILLTSITGVHYSAVGIGLRAIAVVLAGGLESVGGVLIAGPLIGAMEGISAGYLDPLVGGGMRDVTAFVVLILVLMIRPYGLFGWKRIERV
ncbi:MAG: branched-chain amino acid ABC transporter permease [Chloroflexota bacterium]